MERLRRGAAALVWDGGLFDHLSGGVGPQWGTRSHGPSERRRRANVVAAACNSLAWLWVGPAVRQVPQFPAVCWFFATVRGGSIPLPGKAEWSLLMVKAGERVRRCAYRRGQNEPHRGEAGMPDQGYCGLPGSATAEPDLVLPGLRWR